MNAPSTSPDGAWHVVCLCAAWCGVCRDWDALFAALAQQRPALQFDWVDVEDEADALGDVDVETFPTLLVAQGPHVRFFGPVQPSQAQVSRLLDTLLREPRSSSENAAEAASLWHRLRTRVLPKR